MGEGDPGYARISDALQAGSGAPDAAGVEFGGLPSFEVTRKVVNLVPYGANKCKSQFMPWAWKEAAAASGVARSIPSPPGFMQGTPVLYRTARSALLHSVVWRLLGDVMVAYFCALDGDS